MKKKDVAMYRMNFKCHIRTLYDVIERIVGFSIIVLLATSDLISERSMTVLDFSPVIVVFLLGLVVPYMVVYVRYIKLSRKLLVMIDKERERIEIERSKEWLSFNFKDVKLVKKVVTDAAVRRKNLVPKWGDFFCFIIEMKSGKEIIITSLMTNEATVDIDGRENEIQGRRLAWIDTKGRDIVNLGR